MIRQPKPDHAPKIIPIRAPTASETLLLNPGAKIINVQGDFDYGQRFSSTRGDSFLRGKNKEPALQVQYEFSAAGTYRVTCKGRDDMGGEGCGQVRLW